MESLDFSLPSGELTEFTEPSLRRLYEYWLARRRGRRYPRRGDIDPLDFTYVLGNVMLVDVLRNPLRFRMRVHGSEMARRARYDLTGKLLDELPIADYRNYVIERCTRLAETGEPALIHGERVLDGRSHRYEALWLPLSEDGIGVTMLLCGLVYRDR
jgi:hypothetical protein